MNLVHFKTLFLVHDGNETPPTEWEQVLVRQQRLCRCKPQHIGGIGRLHREQRYSIIEAYMNRV